MRRILAAVLVLAAEVGTGGGAAAQRRPMASFDVYEATIAELQAALAGGVVTSVGLVDAYLARIAAYDGAGPALNAILRLNPRAREDAARLDAERSRGVLRGPLHGIPVVVKDNFDTAELETTAGSVALASLIPPDDADQVRRLREAGAIVLAKTNLHELAAGITNISSLGGQTRNPYDPTRNPGGSSGGTAAAVAASFAALGWGSDTCGSIRIPSAHNSLFGLRPTKGLFSTDGVIPLSHTQDVAGPLARTATDLAIGLDAIVDRSARPSSNGRSAPPAFVAALDAASLRGARLGVLEAHFGAAPEDAEVGEVVRNAVNQMRANGAEIVPVEIAGLDAMLEGSSVINYELKHDLMEYLAERPGAPVRSLAEILERGLYHVALEERLRLRERTGTRESPEYGAALQKHEQLREMVTAVLDEHRLDALIYPTMRRVAAPIGEAQRGTNCQLAASTGFPAISIPAGFTESGMPVGVELLGRAHADVRLVALAFSFEQATRHRRPPAFTPPLSQGSAPAPLVFDTIATAGAQAVRIRVAFDAARGAASFAVSLGGIAAQDVLAVTVERGDIAQRHGVVLRLAGPGQVEATGEWTLPASERIELLDRRLVIALYTRQQPHGVTRVPIVLQAQR